MKTGRFIVISDFMFVLRSLDGKVRKTVSDLCCDTGITYSHIFNMKNDLINKGMIIFQLEDKKKYFSLTPYGQEIVDIINLLFNRLGINELNINEFRTKRKHAQNKEPIKEPIKELVEEQYTSDEKEELFLEDDENEFDPNQGI